MNTNHREPNGGDLDEALLTAYALGQLGEGERAAVGKRAVGAAPAAPGFRVHRGGLS